MVLLKTASSAWVNLGMDVTDAEERGRWMGLDRFDLLQPFKAKISMGCYLILF
jgi:hypothetical protein